MVNRNDKKKSIGNENVNWLGWWLMAWCGVLNIDIGDENDIELDYAGYNTACMLHTQCTMNVS